MIYDIHADPFLGFDVNFLLNGLEIAKVFFMDKYKRVVNILYPLYLACEKNMKYNLL